MLAKVVPGEKLIELLYSNLFSHLPMFDHVPSTPQLKPDTYATFDLRYVTQSAEIGVYNITSKTLIERPHSALEYKSGKVNSNIALYMFRLFIYYYGHIRLHMCKVFSYLYMYICTCVYFFVIVHVYI